MKPCTPIPAIYSVLQLSQATLLAGTNRTACFYALPPLESRNHALWPLNMDLEGGNLVFSEVFPPKQEPETIRRILSTLNSTPRKPLSANKPRPPAARRLTTADGRQTSED